MTQNIGIIGGTFDPIHFGHLHTAWGILEQLSLDQIRFIPCGIATHREAPVASAQQRLDMLECAIQSDDKLIIDRREIERDGPSYMIDTLKSLQADFPDAQLHLILGMDAFSELDTWKDWQALMDYTKLVIVRRMPYQLPVDAKFRAWYGEQEAQGKVIFTQDIPLLEISATQLREALRSGRSPRYLLPEAVLHYITENKLYLR